MEGGQLLAAGVSPQLEGGVEEDHDGEGNQELVEQNCADRLAQFHRVYLPRKEGGKGNSVRCRSFPSKKLPCDLLTGSPHAEVDAQSDVQPWLQPLTAAPPWVASSCNASSRSLQSLPEPAFSFLVLHLSPQWGCLSVLSKVTAVSISPESVAPTIHFLRAPGVPGIAP